MINHNKSRQRGFTLLEILVVLVILGLLAGLVGPRVLKHLDSSKTKTAMLQIQELGAALDLYRLEVGSYPNTEQGLDALINRPEAANSWNGPYLKKKVIRMDPWGQHYHYKFPGEFGEYDLFSLGADNHEGGEGEKADIVSWK
ncbi:type II secretion system major pseudopilin GspG [Amphritea japonica]|uniref:Type II secretion system core protein G n=1 Tax=Amphritea japonica ATCC BAA-1530 TaxID=1278309 RepID=A0A7R6SSZ1_9GAMM|nr:type II secretion system major pseudopilin GspG [Amphritea japonica]BBB26755.1 general secretion pathway protein G [Amphritea japonica ATCC BAA-1530]